MITPLWFRLAIGQLIRGGMDYRSYLSQIALVGLFRTREGDMRLVSGWLKSLQCQYVSEVDLTDETLSKLFTDHESLLVGFDKPIYDFTGLNGWHEFLYQELRSITQPKLLQFVDNVGDFPIGINIRCGNDFKSAPSATDYSWIGWLQKTPISWFVETLHTIRERAGWPVPAVVVSDGSKEVLRDLLALENVTFLRPGNAITDMLVLSKSKILLASASSTFSAWACFFGQMPTVTAPGHPMTERCIANSRGQFIGDFNPRNPTEEFLTQVTGIPGIVR